MNRFFKSFLSIVAVALTSWTWAAGEISAPTYWATFNGDNLTSDNVTPGSGFLLNSSFITVSGSNRAWDVSGAPWGTQSILNEKSTTFTLSVNAALGTNEKGVLFAFADANQNKGGLALRRTDANTVVVTKGTSTTTADIDAGRTLKATVTNCDNTYHNYTIVANNGVLSLYVDGEPIKDSNGVVMTLTASEDDLVNDNNFQVGSRFGKRLTDEAAGNGAIDEMVAWNNIALSADEIKTFWSENYASRNTGLNSKILTSYVDDKNVISINFNSGEGSVTGTAGLVAANGWNNLEGYTGERDSLKMWYNGEEHERTLSLTYSSKNGWSYKPDGVTINDEYLKGYLDDGSGVTIELSEIPFATYSVVVYVATDSEDRKFQPVKINDVWYEGLSSKRTEHGYANVVSEEDRSNRTWGASRGVRAEYGRNALRVDGLTSPILTIRGGSSDEGRGPRGCIAAIQIVNTSTFEVEIPADGEDDVAFSELLAYSSLKTDADIVIDFGETSSKTVVFDNEEALNFSSITVTGTNGGTISKTGVGSVTSIATVINTDTTIDAGVGNFGDVTIADNKTLTVSEAYENIISSLTNNGSLAFAGTESAALQYASDDANEMSWAKYVATHAGTYTFCGHVVMDGYSEGGEEAEAKKGWLRFQANQQTINIVDGANITATRLLTSDGPGAATTITQTGGMITLDGTETACNNTKANAILLGHWDATTTYNLKSGSLLAEDGALNLGWDGEAHLTIGRETGGQALVSVKKLCTGNDGTERNKNASVTINPTGTLSIGEFGIQLPSSKSFTLAGGTLQMSVNNAPITLTHTAGLRFTADSTINVAENATITYSGKVTGANKQLTKKGAGILNFVNASKIETLTYKVSAGTLILPAGAEGSEDAEGNIISRVSIEDGGKLVLQLSEVQMVSRYTAKVSQEQLAYVTFRDAHGNPIKEEGSNGTYTPQNVASWVNGEWDREITTGTILQINFGEGSNQTCEISLGGIASIEALKVSGSVAGKIKIVANAEVAIPVLVMDNTETVEVTANKPIKITDKISGNGALTVVSGEVKMTNAAVVATDYAGALTFKNGVKLTWGDNTNTGGAIAGNDYRLGSSLTIETGAKLIPNVFTTGNRNKDKGNKMVFATPVILAGGTIEHPDGSYYYTHITVTETSKIDVNYDKGLVIERLLGEASLTIEGKNTGYGCAFVSVYWTQDKNSNPSSYYCGTLTLQSSAYTGDDNGRYPKMVFYPDTAVAFNKAHIKFGNANVKYLLATNNGARVMGALSGAAADIVHGGNETNPLTIGGYEGAIEPFSGSIDDGVVLNLNENASLKLTGSLGSGGAYSQAITLATGATLDLALAQSTTLSGVISGAGGLTVSSGTLTLTGANTYQGGTTVQSGAILEVNGAAVDTVVLPEGKTVTVNEYAMVNLVQGLSYVTITGDGTTKVTGTYTYGIGTVASDLTTKTVEITDSGVLQFRNWKSDYTFNVDNLVINGTLRDDGFTDGTWTAKPISKMYINESLSGAGAIEVPVVFADGAIIDATEGAVTVMEDIDPTGPITVKGASGATFLTYTGSLITNAGEVFIPETAGLYAAAVAGANDQVTLKLVTAPKVAENTSAPVVQALANCIAQDATIAEKTVTSVTNPDVAELFAGMGVTLRSNDGEVNPTYTATFTYEFGVSDITVVTESGEYYVEATAELGEDLWFVDGVTVELYNVVEAMDEGGEDVWTLIPSMSQITDGKIATITSTDTLDELLAALLPEAKDGETPPTPTSQTLKLKVKVTNKSSETSTSEAGEGGDSSDTGDTGGDENL